MHLFSLPGITFAFLLIFNLSNPAQAASADEATVYDVIGPLELTQGVPLRFTDERAIPKPTTYDITYKVVSYGHSVPHDLSEWVPESCKAVLSPRKLVSIVPVGTKRAALNRYRDNQLLLEIIINPAAKDQGEKLSFPIHPPEEYADYTLLAENDYFYNDRLPVVLFKANHDECLILSGLLDISDIEKKKQTRLELIFNCKPENVDAPECMKSFTRRRTIGGIKQADSSVVYYFLDQNDDLEPGQQFTYFKSGMSAPSPVMVNPIIFDGKKVDFDYSQKFRSIYAGLAISDDHFFVINHSGPSEYLYLRINKSQADNLIPVASLEINQGSQEQQLSLNRYPDILAYKYNEQWCLDWHRDTLPDNSLYEKFVYPSIDDCPNSLISNHTHFELHNFKVGESWQPVISNMDNLETGSNSTSVLGLYQDKGAYNISDVINQRFSEEGLPELNLVYQNDYSQVTKNGYQQVMLFSASEETGKPFTSVQLIATYTPESTSSCDNKRKGLLIALGTTLGIITVIMIGATGYFMYFMRIQQNAGYDEI